MKVSSYTLFLKRLEVEARIGIHAFERDRPQRLLVSIELEMELAALPGADAIEGTFDYDWVREEVRRLVGLRHYDLQETLAGEIVSVLASRREVRRVVVETAKPDVFADAEVVGCRLEAKR
jgi:dihydroneopterin aldolase